MSMPLSYHPLSSSPPLHGAGKPSPHNVMSLIRVKRHCVDGRLDGQMEGKLCGKNKTYLLCCTIPLSTIGALISPTPALNEDTGDRMWLKLIAIMTSALTSLQS